MGKDYDPRSILGQDPRSRRFISGSTPLGLNDAVIPGTEIGVNFRHEIGPHGLDVGGITDSGGKFGSHSDPFNR